jgi:hypothetical protein
MAEDKDEYLPMNFIGIREYPFMKDYEEIWLSKEFKKSPNFEKGWVSQENVIELYNEIGQEGNREIIDHIFYLACYHFDNKYVYPCEEMAFADFLTLAKMKTEN